MISLYTGGCGVTIEVGRFNMSMADARAAFLAVCGDCGITVTPAEGREEGAIFFYLPLSQKNGALLHALANVEDVKADPPNVYTLREEVMPPEGEYAKTNSVYRD